MKRTLLILSLAFAAVPAGAQLADSSDNYVWNNNQWEHELRRIYTYNTDGDYQQVLEMDPLSGELMNKLTYTYNGDGKITMLYVESVVGGQLEPHYRFVYSYDNRGNQVLNRTEEYYAPNMSWEIITGDSVAWTYDGMGRITEYTIHKYSGHSVDPYQKLIWSDFGTDSLPRMLTIQMYYQMTFHNYLEFRNMTWKLGYDPVSVNATSYFGYTWGGAIWNASVYDSTIVVDNKKYRSYLFSFPSMDTMGRTTHMYDMKGRLQERYQEAYNAGHWSGADGSRDSVKYGTYDEMQERIASVFNPNNQAWQYQTKDVFYYHSLSVPTTQTKKLTVYPNPGRDYMRIATDEELSEIRLTDMKGVVTAVEVVDGQIDVSAFAPGIYQLSARGNKGFYTARIQVLP